MKKFRELKVNIPEWLTTNYLAHTYRDQKETLLEHIERTRESFFALIKEGELEGLIDQQILKVFSSQHNEIKELILNLICLHDLGKINPGFQKEKMTNEKYQNHEYRNTAHSELGWLLFNLYFFDFLENIKNDSDWKHATVLTTVIAGHHTCAWGINRNKDKELKDQKISFELEPLEQDKIIFSKEKKEKVRLYFEDILNSQKPVKKEFYSLYKTIYSILIVADSIATGIAKGKPATQVYKIKETDLEEWFETFTSTNRYKNAVLQYEESKNENPQYDNINQIRNKILLESEHNLKAGIKKGNRVFYFQAPTGAGKTNCSINFILQTLRLDKSIKRGIFVYPFINIIDQSVEEIKKGLGVEHDDVLEVHSLAQLNTQIETNGEKFDETERKYDDRVFLNNKIIITSQVNFFEALGNSSKSDNYRYLFLSNSIIVIDEIQTIDDTQWTVLAYLLERFATDNNAYVVLMSATLPRIHNINLVKTDKEFLELLPNATTYAKSSLFGSRTKLIPRLNVQNTEQLLELVNLIVKEHKGPIKLLIVVNTIKRSQAVYGAVVDRMNNFEVQLLNSQLLPSIRKKIIEQSKKVKGKNYILVSTQCIEAGIDADFDVGIRDIAILDSLEQVAGRVNREGTKGTCPVYIIALQRNDDPKTIEASGIYGKSNRWESFYASSELQNIINNRDFERYYDLTIQNIDRKTKMPGGHEIDERENFQKIQKFELDKLRDYKLIKDSDTQTFFIPINIDKMEFSESELKLLPETIENNQVVGHKMWEVYRKISEMNGSRYQKIRLAQINSMLSKFLVRRRKRKEEVFDDAIIFLDNWQNSYDIQRGFKNVGEADII